jgi:hypothetical protein
LTYAARYRPGTPLPVSASRDGIPPICQARRPRPRSTSRFAIESTMRDGQ